LGEAFIFSYYQQEQPLRSRGLAVVHIHHEARSTMSKPLTETSKFLSYVLRHEPQSIGLSLDTEGWVGVDALIAAAAQHGRTLDRPVIEQVVATSEKKRFSLSADGSSDLPPPAISISWREV